MNNKEYCICYEIECSTHGRAYAESLDQLNKSLMIGFEYDVKDYSITIIGDGLHEVEIRFELIKVPERIKCNLALHSFFPNGNLKSI